MVDGQGLREYMANGTFMRRDFREISENMERIATPSVEFTNSTTCAANCG